MASLNLPSAVEDSASGSDVPQSILDKAAAVRTAGGVKELRDRLASIVESRKVCEDVLADVSQLWPSLVLRCPFLL